MRRSTIELPIPVGATTATVRGELVGDGPGPPVLVLHGGGPGCSSASDFDRAIPTLAAARPLLLLDLLQAGRSEFAPITEPAASFHARTVGAVLDHLGLGRVDAVAQSMGSAVLLALARLDPGRLRRAVLTSVGPFTPERTVELGGDPGIGGRAWQACFADGPPSERRMARVLGEFEWHDAEAIPSRLVRQRREIAARPHQAAMAADRGLRGEPEDLEPSLPTLELDAAVVWGASDPFVTPAMREALLDGLRPRTHAIVAGASHHLQSEAPDAWLAFAAPFLDGGDRTPARETRPGAGSRPSPKDHR